MMLIMLLLSSCLFHKLDGQYKGKRDEISQAIKGGDNERLKLLLDITTINQKDLGERMPMHEAAEIGNIAALEILIAKGAEIGGKGCGSATPLMLASQNGHRSVCELLLEKGCEKNATDKDGWTALMMAAQNGHEKVCELLLDKGCDKDIMNRKDERTALMIAAYKGHREVCELLLEKGSDKDAMNKNGVTALMIAAQNGHGEVCELLLEKGSNSNAVDKNRKTVLMHAARFGGGRICELFLERGSDINAVDKDGATVLMYAAKSGGVEICELLLEKGSDINAVDKDGKTVLMYAAKSGRVEICELLLEKGSDINAVDGDGSTVLMMAAECGKDICELLLEKGGDINAVDKDGKTVLMHAARFGGGRICELFLERGSDINAVDKDGATVLMYAAKSGGVEICELLLEKGSDINAVDKDGKTVLMYAARGGNREVCELLLEKKESLIDVVDKDGRTVLIHAVTSIFVHSLYIKQTCELLLKKRASLLDVADKRGWTALVYSLIHLSGLKQEVPDFLLERKLDSVEANGWSVLNAFEWRMGTCKLLLEKKESLIDIADKHNRRTVLTYAVEFASRETCELLLEKRENLLDVEDKNGATVLMYAAKSGRVEICELLLEKRRSLVNAVDKNGRTALTHAAMSGHKKICELLKGASLIEGALVVSPDFLLENFTEIKKRSKKSFGALHLAAISEESRALEFLLGHDTVIVDQSVGNFKQDRFIDDSDNAAALSPIRLALKHERMENAKLLLAHGASPLYTKWFSKRVLLEEEPVLREFLAKGALFSLLKLGRVEAAKRLIAYSFGAIAYRDIIDLRAKDENGMNVYHYVAQYCCENIAVLEFLNRSIEMKSFSKVLLNEYDEEGFTPIHRAVMASNPYFIQHLPSLNLLERKELNVKTRKGNFSILELVIQGLVDEETVEAVIKYIIAGCVSEDGEDANLNNKVLKGTDPELRVIQLEEFLREGGDINARSDGECSVLEDIVTMNDVMLLSYVSKAKEIDWEQVCVLALELFRQDILEFLSNTFMGYEAIRGGGPVTRAISKVSLHNLCAEGKEASVKMVLRFRRDCLRQRDEEGELPLHAAARKGRVNIARILLEQEEVVEEINAVNSRKQSVIHCAVMGFSAETISVLVERGCGLVSAKDADGKRPIDLIVGMMPRDKGEESERAGVIYALLCAMEGKGYDDHYESAINLAIKHDEVGIVKELLREGYCSYKDEKENTPLHAAVEKGNKEVVSAVLSCTKDFAVKNLEGRIPLHLVREVEIMREYFDKAIEMDIESNSLLNDHVDSLREAPLHSVVRSAEKLGLDKAKILVRYMLDNRADRSRINNKSLTAEGLCRDLGLEALGDLIRDYEPNFSEMIERRRKREAELASEQLRKEARDVALILNGEMGVNELLSGRSRRAIHYAIDNRDSAKMERLLELGANLMMEDKDGNTAYRLAASMGVEILDSLLDKAGYGDLLRPDSKKETIMHIGLKKGGKFEQAVLKGLRAKGVQEPQLFFVAIDYRREEAIKEFFKLGFDVKVRDSQGKTVLKYIIDSAGKAEARGLEEKDKLQRCFRCVLAGIKRSYDLASVLFSADDEWKTAMGAALSVSDSFYLSEILKRTRVVLEEDEERIIAKGKFYEKLNSEIEGKIRELLNRPEHMITLLDSHSGMSNILVQGEESTFGKAIYLAAERKNEDAVKSMIASYVTFKSRKDIVYDKARGYIPMIVQPVCVALGMGAVGKVLDSILSSRSEDEYEAIRFIDEVYKEGEWALNVEIIPVKDLLRYYKRAAKNLKEISREEVERKLAQSRGEIAGNTGRFKRAVRGIRASARNAKIAVKRAIKRELEKTDGSLLDVMFEVGEPAILEETLRESYVNRRELMKSDILNSLDSYTTHHKEYEECIAEDIRPVIKGRKDWNSEFGVILKELYAKLMKARRELKDKLYDYIEYTSYGYAVEAKSERTSFV